MVQKPQLVILIIATFLAISSFRDVEAAVNRTCYECDNCSDNFATMANKTGCSYCLKQTIGTNVKRSCQTGSGCVAANLVGQGLFCCDDKDLCNAEPGAKGYLSYATLAASMLISLFLTKIHLP